MRLNRTYTSFTLAFIIIAVPASNLAAQNTEKQAQQIGEMMNLFTSERQFSGVVLIAQTGEVVFEEAYGLANLEAQTPNTVDTKFWIASMSKQFAAAVAMLLVQDSTLLLDNRVYGCLNA